MATFPVPAKAEKMPLAGQLRGIPIIYAKIRISTYSISDGSLYIAVDF